MLRNIYIFRNLLRLNTESKVKIMVMTLKQYVKGNVIIVIIKRVIYVKF